MPVKTDSLYALTCALQPTKQAWQQAAGRVLAESGLSLSLAAPILVVSRLGDGALQHVIAERIGVHPAALVRTPINRTREEAGLFERRTVPGNRRLRAIHLSPEGRRLAVKMEHALMTLQARLPKILQGGDGSGHACSSGPGRALSPLCGRGTVVDAVGT